MEDSLSLSRFLHMLIIYLDAAAIHDDHNGYCYDVYPIMLIASNSHQPLSEAGKIAVASVSVFLVTFALAFAVGYVTGHCCHKKSSEPAETNVSPLYDTIQVEHSKRDVAMSENIAYSTVQPSL